MYDNSVLDPQVKLRDIVPSSPTDEEPQSVNQQHQPKYDCFKKIKAAQRSSISSGISNKGLQVAA